MKNNLKPKSSNLKSKLKDLGKKVFAFSKIDIDILKDDSFKTDSDTWIV